MKKFDVWLTVTTRVIMHKTLTAKDADEARRTFVNRIGKWESTQSRLLPDLEMTESVFPNQDYSGDDFEVEEHIDQEEDEVQE